jgi:hypothetical protein
MTARFARIARDTPTRAHFRGFSSLAGAVTCGGTAGVGGPSDPVTDRLAVVGVGIYGSPRCCITSM